MANTSLQTNHKLRIIKNIILSWPNLTLSRRENIIINSFHIEHIRLIHGHLMTMEKNQYALHAELNYQSIKLWQNASEYTDCTETNSTTSTFSMPLMQHLFRTYTPPIQVLIFLKKIWNIYTNIIKNKIKLIYNCKTCKLL